MSFTGWGGSRKPGTSAVGRIRGARDTRLTVQSGGEMHIALRLLGLDVLDLTVETDAAASDEPGDSTTNVVGFQAPESPPLEVVLPEWR